MRALSFLSLSLCVACGATVEEPVSLRLEGEEATALRVTTNAGDIALVGSSTPVVRVAGVSIGRGMSMEKAREASAENAWQGRVEGSLITVDGQASRRGIFDLSIDAPEGLTTDIVAQGMVFLEGGHGGHTVTAAGIVGRELGGALDLYAREHGIDVSLATGHDPVRLQSYGGDVVLSLPSGPDYDLTVIIDPAFELRIEGLSLDRDHREGGSFRGHRGAADVDVFVIAEGGNVTVRGSVRP
jgi:hypothetical protein